MFSRIIAIVYFNYSSLPRYLTFIINHPFCYVNAVFIMMVKYTYLNILARCTQVSKMASGPALFLVIYSLAYLALLNY